MADTNALLSPMLNIARTTTVNTAVEERPFRAALRRQDKRPLGPVVVFALRGKSHGGSSPAHLEGPNAGLKARSSTVVRRCALSSRCLRFRQVLPSLRDSVSIGWT